jgi:hypothetical protein
VPKPDKALEGGPKLEKVCESVLKVEKSSKKVPQSVKVC